ncbi:hypothetical protein NHQ30_003326 [Ciborinia camelliae]|nr:hypothetical protein NHQ30_003326 [Ciborinia camelliae]
MEEQKNPSEAAPIGAGEAETQYPTGLRLYIILGSLILGTTLMSLDTTIISVATPTITADFHALDDVGWYGAAYLMALTSTTPISANLYKYFNPKSVYLVSIFIFEVGSLVCALAPSSGAFIAGRAVAGLGAGALLQGAFGILTYVCTLEMRSVFLGLVVSVFGLFSSIGPLIGGALTERVDWRWCFWINLPIGGAVFCLVVIFLSLKGVDESTRKLALKTKLRRLDFPGVVIIIASTCCLFLALQEGGTTAPWNSARPIGLIIGFGLLLIIFVLWQWKAGENATIPLRYLNDRTVLWGSIYLFWDNMASYITIYYLPFYFQAGLGQSPIRSAVSYISLAIPQMIGLLAGGGITTITGHYMPVVLFAQVLCAIGSGLLTTLQTDTSTAKWATYMVLTGLGLGLGVNVPHIAIQAVMETALGAPIGSALLVGGLRHEIPKFTSKVSAEDVINAGATGLTSITRSPELIQKLRHAYTIAVSHVMVFLVIVICISVPTAFGMKWLNIKKISMQREADKRREVSNDDVRGQRSDAEKTSA